MFLQTLKKGRPSRSPVREGGGGSQFHSPVITESNRTILVKEWSLHLGDIPFSKVKDYCGKSKHYLQHIKDPSCFLIKDAQSVPNHMSHCLFQLLILGMVFPPLMTGILVGSLDPSTCEWSLTPSLFAVYRDYTTHVGSISEVMTEGFRNLNQSGFRDSCHWWALFANYSCYYTQKHPA